MRKKFIVLCFAALSLSSLTACNKHTHSYDVEHPVWAWSQFSSATVTFTCSNCQDTVKGHIVTLDATIENKETVKATCEADGYKTFVASATFLEKVYTDSKTQTLPKLGHVEDTSSWQYDETNHWHNCSNCGDSYHFSVGEHTFTEWETKIEADHYNKGSKERYCSVCKYTEVEEIAMSKFTYDEVKAIHDKFVTFDAKSYYISHVSEQLAYSIENIDDAEKSTHEEELNEWAKAAKAANDYFTTNFSVVIDAEGVDTYENVVTSDEFYDGYGTVLKINASNEFTGENWTFGANKKIEFADDVDTLVFAVYNKNPMDIMIANSACNKFYHPVSNGTWMENRNATSCLSNDWTEFQISVSELEDFDSLHIALYLMGSPYGGYGIPTVGDSAEKGSAYMTEIVGIKSAYYKTDAEGVVNKIEALKTLDKSSLTLWNGGQILEARNLYDALPSSVQAYVTNLSILEEYETAYAEIGTAYNTNWEASLINGNNSVISKSVLDYDEKYGLYNQISGTSTWIINLTPASNTAISASSAKIAIYNPNQSEYILWFYTTKSWTPAFNTNDAEGYENLKPGWNEYEVPLVEFEGGVVSGLTIAFNNTTEISDFKFTPIYSTK